MLLDSLFCGSRQTPPLYGDATTDVLDSAFESFQVSGQSTSQDERSIEKNQLLDQEELAQRLDDLRREIDDAKLDW